MIKVAAYLLSLLALIVSAGCTTSGYAKFYTDFTHKYGAIEPNKYILLQSDQEPQVMAGTILEVDSFSMQSEGYVPVGYSSFKGKLENIKKATDQARKVGATHVLIYTQYLPPGVDSLSLTNYIPVKVTRTNQYGNNQVISSSQSINNRSYLTQSASYWVKRTQWELGAYIEDVSDLIKQNSRVSKGCSLVIVVKNTAAYNAGLISGDIVVQYNEIDLDGYNAFKKMIESNTTGKVLLLIFRDGEYLNKTVTLNIEGGQL